VLAVAGNSPTLLGHRLWEETRIALCKQSIDDRDGRGLRRRLARVAFGTGWLRDGPLELFTDSVRLHQPLLPILSNQDPLAGGTQAQAPPLAELRLHQGTVWRWNRAIYDPALGWHLRIELRALPAGPTVTDMLANAAFLIGLSRWLAAQDQRWTYRLSFERAEHGFYRAAQHGLAAELTWPLETTAGCARSRRQARCRGAAGRPGRADRCRRGRRRGRPPAWRDRRPGDRRADRGGVAAPDAGHPGAAARPRACAGGDARALPSVRSYRPAGSHLAHQPLSVADHGSTIV
jgi:hypothetical protein